jgi:hypothetical protein
VKYYTYTAGFKTYCHPQTFACDFNGRVFHLDIAGVEIVRPDSMEYSGYKGGQSEKFGDLTELRLLRLAVSGVSSLPTALLKLKR